MTLRRKDTDAEHFSDGEQTLYHAERRLSRHHIRYYLIKTNIIYLFTKEYKDKANSTALLTFYYDFADLYYLIIYLSMCYLL